jgi:hypothetical protein
MTNESELPASPAQPGSPGTISNTQCSIDMTTVSVHKSGNDLVLSMTMTFAPGFAGVADLQGDAFNATYQDAGFRSIGSFTVGTTPSSGLTIINGGPLKDRPSNCAPGTLYFASDQPPGQQVYICPSQNIWAQFLTIGPSGALLIENGALDINTKVSPRLQDANIFTGMATFASAFVLQDRPPKPACDARLRGMFWFEAGATVTKGPQRGATQKDSVGVCLFDGSHYTWITLY